MDPTTLDGDDVSYLQYRKELSTITHGIVISSNIPFLTFCNVITFVLLEVDEEKQTKDH